MQDLLSLRKTIDTLDDEIIALLAKRQTVVHQVAEYKMHNSLKVYDAAREHYLHDLHQQLSIKHGVSFMFVRRLFALIMEESRRLQSLHSDSLKCEEEN